MTDPKPRRFTADEMESLQTEMLLHIGCDKYECLMSQDIDAEHAASVLRQAAATERERERIMEALRGAIEYLDGFLPACHICAPMAGRHVADCENLDLINLIDELRELSREDSP